MKVSIRNIGKNRPANNFHKLLTACFVYVAIFLSPLSTVSQTAPVLEPLGGFAIDGDLQANTPVLDIGDWVMGPAGAGGHVLHNDGSALDSLNSGLFLDNYDGNDMIFQGSKFNQNPDLWSWSVGKANSKNDINNVMYHLAKDGSGNMWIMLGSDRLSTSGTSYIDFEFLQNPLVRTSDFGFNSAGPHGGRTINDMIVSVEYSNGGSAGNVRIYLWEPVGTGYDYVEQTIPAGIAFASTNSSTVPVPFGAFGSTSYSPYQFAEAAVNISDLFGALDPCLGLSVKTIIVKTKASTSQTANLGDFAEPIQVSLSLGTAEISYNNNMDLCPTGTVSPVINGVEDGTFSANPSGLSLNTATGEIDLDNSLPGDYTITYSFITNGCPRTADTDITILESPEAPVSASSDSSILCADHADSLTLSAAGGSGDVLNWYSDACQGNLIGTGNNLSIPAPSSTTTYYAAWENSCGISACAELTVTVLPELLVTPSITSEISAFNATDGEITVAASGGTGNYMYSIDGGTPQASNVFSNLAAGTYIVEVTDDHGCIGTASITLNNALEIIANDDVAGGINGYTGAQNVLNVFDNDSLNGSPVNPADVNLSETVADSTATLTLNPDGSVDVAPGSPAGTYELTYQICEVANPTNCDDATVSITLVPAQIIANDDSAAGVNGYTGQTGILNVFANDSLNGTAVDPLEVVLTETIADPGGNLTLNPDGSVDLAAGTPAGAYTLTYQICEILNPANCDDAIVTVTVSAPQIVANDDSAAGIDGTAGATNILNVFDNDLLNGAPLIPAEVNLSVVNPNPYISLNPDGSVDVPAFTPGGTYTMTYEICELLNPGNCDQAIVTIEVIKTSDVSIVKSHIDPSNLPVGDASQLIEISPSVITAGTKIYYFLLVENSGPDNALEATIEDNLPAGISNAEYSLNFGNSWFSWGGSRYLADFLYPGDNYVMIRGDVDPDATGTLTNTGTIYSAVTPDPDLSNNESTVVTNILSSADLELTKRSLTSPIVIGGQIVYEISVTNYGPSLATDVIITDNIDPAIISGAEYSTDGGSSWTSSWTGSLNIGNLNNGDVFTLLIRGSVVDASPSPNVDPIPNTASVTSSDPDPDPSNNEETINTPLNTDADISIAKSGPASIIAGTQIQYAISVTNNSNTFVSENVHIHDVIDSAIIANAEYSVDGGTSWTAWTGDYLIGDMAPLANFGLLIRGDVVSSHTGNVINTASVETDTPDSDVSNNTSTATTTVEIVADLDIVKIQIDPSILPLSQAQIYGNPNDLIIDPVEITAGEEITYALLYGNDGPSDATNVIVEDILPGYIVDWEASACQANYGPWPGSYNLGTIVSGGSCVLIIRGSVLPEATGNLVNTASIHSDDVTDPVSGNDTSSFVTPIQAMADLSISKTVDNSTPFVGDTVNFTISLTNNGPSDASSVSVTDQLPDGYTYVAHTVTSGSYNPLNGIWDIGTVPFPGSETLTITATVNLPGGNNLNVAGITSLDQYDPDSGNDEDNETTNPVNVIIALDDAGGPVNGYTGAANVLNVFDNDSLNGSTVIPADLILTETLADPTGNLTLNADGSVDLAPNTPAGTYTLTYQICEIANPTNCDDAIATITVDAPEIIANDDIAGSVNGYDGQINVLGVFDNDLLNGNPVDPADVNLTETVADPGGNLTLQPDGSVDVAPGTPAGTYSLTYEICEVTNPANCDDAIVTISVNAPQIIANNDSASGVNGYDGVSAVLNVFDNDSLNGDPVIPAEVILTETLADPTSSLSLNPDGTVDIAPGTPAGTYTFTYEICEVLNPSNCDDATVTVTVSATSIIAVDDSYYSVNGYDGMNTILNVLDNDSLNGNPVIPAEVILSETVPEPNGYIIMNPDGSIDVPAGTPAGIYYLSYEICEAMNPSNCDDALVTVKVDPPQIIAIEDSDTDVNGYTGETNVLNVFDNDLLNGNPVDPAEVSLSETVPEPNGYLVLNPDGSVDVMPGTPAGTHTLIYEICENLNPANCSDAPVFITISAAAITAADDNFSSTPLDCETGGIAGNVLDNDLLDAAPLDPADVTITLTDDGGISGAVISANGDLNIPAGLAVGSYSLSYQICEVINPANCDNANITVVVQDTVDPTISCADDIVINNDAGNCEATGVNITPPTTNDNCGVASLDGVRSDMLDLSDPYPIGTTTITWTVTDHSGNSATCEQLVSVNDNQPPTITCPAPVAVNTDPDECTASDVVLGTPEVDDNCTVTSVTNDAPATFPIGNTTVTWTVTDSSGNTASCEQIVTVTDIELPTITCPAPVAVNTDPDECTASGVVLGTPVVDDNCTVTSVTNDAPATFPIGNTTVTWTVTDSSGNIASCEQIVTVTDIELPSITCPEDINACTNIIELVDPEVYDNCGIDEISNNAPEVFPAGTTTVSWTVTDVNGNVSNCEQLVHVSLMDVTVEASSQVSCTDAGDAEITVSVEGAFGDVTYSLNGASPQASNTFSGLSAGTYTVLVEDDNGCTFLTDEIIISNPSPIEAELTVSSQVSCFDGNDGSIEVSATGGTGQLTYSLNDGPAQTSGSFENLEAGTYTILIEDENMCSLSLTDIIIENPEALSLGVDASDAVSCYGATDGAIEVSVNGGTGDYYVNLSNQSSGQEYTASSAFNFENLSAGDYVVSVSDANGCSEMANATIGTPEAMTLSHTPYCEAGVVGVELTASGGNGNYEYSIDAGETWTQSNRFEDLENNPNLMLMATDGNNCLSEIIEIPVESLNTLNASAELISGNKCYGLSDAAVQINTEGGVAPYVYTVNGEDTYYSNQIDSLSAGDYTIHIQDANECPAVTEISIESRDEIIVDLVSTTNADCNGNNNGTVEIEAYGGFGEFEYKWSNGESTGLVTNLNAGTHTVTVSDMNACEVTKDFIIESDITGEELTVNNVFTPNRDGINDFFVISNLDLYPDNELVVLNRWGNEVYSKKSYDNLWDGSNLSEGTYFYVLKVKMCDEYKTLNGYITILD